MSPHDYDSSDDSGGSDSGSEYGKVKKDKKSKDKKEKKDKGDKKDKGEKKDKKDKDKKDKDKDKKDKDKKDKDKGHKESDYGYGGAPSFPSAGHQADLSVPAHRVMPAVPSMVHPHAPSPAGNQQAPPASGFRIPMQPTSPFPEQHLIGTAPCHDLDGSPVYIGSALFDKSVQPCKIGPHLSPPCLVAFGGQELGHTGRFDLLPFDPSTMEFVRASYGQLPPGRRLVEGGYEESGAPLFHAIANVNGLRVPGKAGSHLGGCNVSFGGAEHAFQDNYEVLCWK